MHGHLKVKKVAKLVQCVDTNLPVIHVNVDPVFFFHGVAADCVPTYLGRLQFPFLLSD